MVRSLIVTTQKNEGAFLLEWLAHHKSIGFDDILVLSNDCSDGNDTMLDRLQDMGELTMCVTTVPMMIAAFNLRR